MVDAVEKLLDFRSEMALTGIAIETLYSTLREPGKNRLRALHEDLDAAVERAYGFVEDDDPRAQLLALNASIALEEQHGGQPRAPGNQGLDGTYRTTYRIESKLRL